MRTNANIVTELKRVPTSSTQGWTPYLRIWYYTSGAPHDGAGEFSRIDNLGSKNRILDVRASIEPYAASCTITLNNSESSYDATASTYKGKWLSLQWGLYCLGSDSWEAPAEASVYYYCVGYSFVSEIVNGRSMDVLKLYGEGAWNRLGRLMAVPDLDTPANGAPFYYNQPLMDATRDGYDADDIFAQLCDMAGIFKSTLGAWSDYVTSWEPEVTFDYDTTVAGHVGPTGDVAAMLILQPFRVRAVPRADGLYLTVPGVSTDWTFKCPTDASYQPFNGGYKTSMESLPAKVTVVCGDYDGTYGSSSIGGYNYDLANAWNLCASDANCAWVAQSIVELISEQQESGVIDVPILNPLLELYDYVTVVDQRGNVSTTTGRVGGLFYHYAPGQGIYGMKVRLGGLATDGSSGSGGGTGYGPAATSPEVIKVRTGPHGIANDALISKLFQPGLKPWTSTVVFAPKVGDTHDSVEWAAGVIKWNDGVKADQTIDAGSISNITESVYTYIYFTEGDATLNSSTDIVDAMGNTNGLLAIVYASSTYADSEIGIQCFKSKGDNWNGEFIAAKSISTVHLEAECVTADEIKAGEIDVTKMVEVGGSLMDGRYSSFEVWTTSPGCPDNWVVSSGAAAQWATYTTAVKHGTNAARVTCNSATQTLNWGTPIRADENDKITITAWIKFSDAADGAVGIGFACYDKDGAYLDVKSTTWAVGTFVSGTWAEKTYTGQCVAGTYFIRPRVTATSANTTGYWYFDDVRADRSGIIIVHGTVGGTRTEITGDHVAGYNGATLQWEGKSSDGKFYAGGGAVVLDNDGIKITGEDTCNFYNDDEDLVGYIAGLNSHYLLITSQADILILADELLITVADECVVSGDLRVTGAFTPLRTSQNAAPAPTAGELRIWHDADDHKVYLIYTDATEGVVKVELTA